MINPHIPIFNNDKINNNIVLKKAPIKVPIIASLAIFIACILVVKGPWI